jgi:hypothetical protein
VCNTIEYNLFEFEYQHTDADLTHYKHALTKKNLTYHSWNKWWFDSSVQQFFPLDCPEEGLFLHILGISFAGPESTIGILSQQLQQNCIYYSPIASL